MIPLRRSPPGDPCRTSSGNVALPAGPCKDLFILGCKDKGGVPRDQGPREINNGYRGIDPRLQVFLKICINL
jgi:hypothetical protein